METNEQSKFWKGEFGDEYTLRNIVDYDSEYIKQYGLTRTNLNKLFVGAMPLYYRFLEVGCNIGSQLQLLKKAGFDDLWGIDINKRALDVAKDNAYLNVVEGNIFDIPFKDNFADIVFTSGVLIHIAPENLNMAFDEMVRVTKKYIWCFEYYSEECEEIMYRNNTNKLWKNDFMKLLLDRYPNLEIVKKEVINRADGFQDMMFILEKKP